MKTCKCASQFSCIFYIKLRMNLWTKSYYLFNNSHQSTNSDNTKFVLTYFGSVLDCFNAVCTLLLSVKPKKYDIVQWKIELFYFNYSSIHIIIRCVLVYQMLNQWVQKLIYIQTCHIFLMDKRGCSVLEWIFHYVSSSTESFEPFWMVTLFLFR